MGMKALLVLLVAVSASSGLNIELKIQNDPQCKYKGQQCSSDLSQVIYCTAKGGDSHIVVKCESGRSCVRTPSGEYHCSGGGDAPESPVVCTGNEAIPDANQCNKAYICESSGAAPKHECTCPDGSALVFTPGMTCKSDSKLLEDCKCPKTDRCRGSVGAGDFGLCHPQFYYVCNHAPSGGLVPNVYKCPTGEYYDKEKRRCEKPRVAVALTETNGNDPVCKRYFGGCHPELNVSCRKAGELLPHGTVDRCYYYCDSNLRPTVRDCGPGSYFTTRYGQPGCVFDSRPQ